MATQHSRSNKPPKSKSSLLSHTFPPFYACYLLKSIRNPKSTATYIGSTPHPPRRIRQHNGEITQGAWKTAQNRPWVMSMIVHGFPSKLAALQFEWAWQHPNLSRHLREEVITKGRTLKANIAVARSMLTSHPYTSWPLHVKLFTPEAVKGWNEACKSATVLPPGFTYSVELEGVDGKFEGAGSGRQGAIDVTDKEFTTEHLAKHTTVLSTGESRACTVCGSQLDFRTAHPLSLALCPTSDCTAYAHLTCLASSFLASADPSNGLSMIPRGGDCVRCRKYVLWGDIIRGCYRRRTGGGGTVVEQSAIIEEAEVDEADGREVFAEEPAPQSKRKASPTKMAAKRRKKAQPLQEEGEFFDPEVIDKPDLAPPGIAEKSPQSSPRPRGRPAGSKNKGKSIVVDTARNRDGFEENTANIIQKVPSLDAGDEFSELDNTCSSGTGSSRYDQKMTERSPRRRGRPVGSKNKPKKTGDETARAVSDTGAKTVRRVKRRPQLEEGEFFDLDAVGSDSSSSRIAKEATATPLRPRGRPASSRGKPKASRVDTTALYDIDDFSSTKKKSAEGMTPFRPSKSGSRAGSDEEFTEAFASMSMHDVMDKIFAQRKRNAVRAVKRRNDVIEISD